MKETSREGSSKPRKRPHRVHVRMTQEEYDQVREQAQIVNKKPATFLRALSMGEPLRPVPRFPPDVQRAIKSFGPNLNQLSHAANRGVLDKGEVDKLRKSVSELLEALGVN